jgi:hypothetical protein
MIAASAGSPWTRTQPSPRPTAAVVRLAPRMESPSFGRRCQFARPMWEARRARRWSRPPVADVIAPSGGSASLPDQCGRRAVRGDGDGRNGMVTQAQKQTVAAHGAPPTFGRGKPQTLGVAATLHACSPWRAIQCPILWPAREIHRRKEPRPKDGPLNRPLEGSTAMPPEEAGRSCAATSVTL